MKTLSIILTVALMGIATTTFAQEINKPVTRPERPQFSQNERGPRGPMGPGPRGPQFRGGRDSAAMHPCQCPCHKQDGPKQGKGRQFRGGRK